MNIKKVLEQALKAMDFYDYTGTVEESETYIKAIVQCKQAIEWLDSEASSRKQEPVAWYMLPRDLENELGYLSPTTPTRDEKISHKPLPLYLYPSKQLFG